VLTPSRQTVRHYLHWFWWWRRRHQDQSLLVAPPGMPAQARVTAHGIRITGGTAGMPVMWNRPKPATTSQCTPRLSGSRYSARLVWTFWPTTASRHPGGPAISLALIWLPATDQAHRIGSVLTNPGGPGFSGVDSIRRVPPGAYPPGMRARFDIVGFDPRGVARSAPLRCFASDRARSRFFAGVPLFPITRREQVLVAAKNTQFGGICLRHDAAIMRHMSTANAARDMDLLRRALGDRKLTFYGASYGSYLGNVYASLFPHRVRALVFDSIIDPAAWATGHGDGFSVPVYTRQRSDTGTAATMRQFLQLCDRAGPRCAFSGGDPQAKWRTLLARARRAPIPLPGGQRVGYADIVWLTVHLLSDPAQSWAELARNLQALYQASTPAARTPSAATAADTATAAYDNTIEALAAVTCADTTNPRDPFRWAPVARQRDRRFGPFGSFWAYLSEPCATWPAADHDRYTGPFGRRTAAPVLIIGTRFDPATPYSNARALARQLPGSRLLTLDGWGHVALGKSTCIAAYVDRYLVNLALPPPGTACRPDQRPFG
jgi:pimeloyl-ACP methyl ester carboxylesterase